MDEAVCDKDFMVTTCHLGFQKVTEHWSKIKAVALIPWGSDEKKVVILAISRKLFVMPTDAFTSHLVELSGLHSPIQHD